MNFSIKMLLLYYYFIDFIFTKVHTHFGLWCRYIYIQFYLHNLIPLFFWDIHRIFVFFLLQEFHYFSLHRSFPQLNFQPFPSVLFFFHLLLLLFHYSFRISQDFKCCYISLVSRFLSHSLSHSSK